MAIFICARPVSSSWQKRRTSAGRMSALQAIGAAFSACPLKRLRCTCRAASTRFCSTGVYPDGGGDGSPSRALLSLSYSTRGTSTWMSMRSSSGPEMRFWYLVTVPAEQVQAFTGSPK